jgi:hypothetical protein
LSAFCSVSANQHLRLFSERCAPLFCAGLEELQERIASVLLEKLPDYMSEQSQQQQLQAFSAFSVPRLILTQLRWLDTVYDSPALGSKLLQVAT